MTTTLAPFGLKPVFHPTGISRPQALDGGITSGYASSIFLGDPVRIPSGTGVLAVSTGSDTILGSFAGCEYTDTFGRTHEQASWAANTVATNIRAYFHSDPFVVYAIQSSGSLAQTAIGNQADTTIGSGSTVTQVSAATIGTSLAGGGASKQLRILGLFPLDGNAWGDTYTIVLVNISKHQFLAPANANL